MEQGTQCRTCGVVKPPSDFYPYRRFQCKQCHKKKHDEWRTSEAGRANVKALKTRYRRLAGSQPMQELRRLAAERKAITDRLELEREQQIALARIGPPRPTPTAIGPAAAFRWRYQNDESFREFQKERARLARKKDPLPDWRIRERLKVGKAVDIPPELIEAKRMQIRVNQLLREKQHENDRPAA